MKAVLRQRALELGFDDCRFTTAEPPASAARFQAWLRAGRHGEMGYLERHADRRTDPRRVLPGARSVITLAASYAQREECQEAGDPRSARAARHPPPVASHGFLARYARFADYHAVLGERLQTLTGFVNELGGEGTRSLWYVDTGPVLERDLAQRAGLGFIGKHANLISRKLGNWILLAEILTTLDLEPDAPETNRCGTCARCLAACPTGALVAPFQLDARRCISYLTIELKGPIPVEWRPAIGDRIFGCDDCLAACPWNRFAREGTMLKAHARPDLAAPDLLEWLRLDDAGFRTRFAGTPLWRGKRRGLARNVCVALGNVGDETALPALRAAAANSEPLVAEHARWAIEQIQKRLAAV
jgi:epoxyqueuosine reductase